MSLTAEVEEWRLSLARDFAFDGKPPPSEEDVLRQFLYSAVCLLLESDEWWPRVMVEDDAWENVVDEWVDWYAERNDPVPA